MAFWKKETCNDYIDIPETETAPEEWIWVEGYKGTDENML